MGSVSLQDEIQTKKSLCELQSKPEVVHGGTAMQQNALKCQLQRPTDVRVKVKFLPSWSKLEQQAEKSSFLSVTCW